jgi:hypothetical protein
MSEAAPVPVTDNRLAECLASARFWERELGTYAEQTRSRANLWSWVSIICSSLTGLAVWSTLAASVKWPAVLLVSIVAFVAAIAAAAPKVGKYDETSKAAANLQTEYGHSIGELEDAAAAHPKTGQEAQAARRKAVKDFEGIKDKKDELVPFSRRLQKVHASRNGGGHANLGERAEPLAQVQQ